VLPTPAGKMHGLTRSLLCQPTVSNASLSNWTMGSASTMTSLISDRWLAWKAS
jgi:hypothetical protein